MRLRGGEGRCATSCEGVPPRLIDEVHRGRDWLIRAIKMTVDGEPRPGQFVLSGSSRFLSVPTLSESLAGRAVSIDLWPLSVAERTHGSADFLTRVIAEPSALANRDSVWTCEAQSPCFYALGIGLGFVTAVITVSSQRPGPGRGCPRWRTPRLASHGRRAGSRRPRCRGP